MKKVAAVIISIGLLSSNLYVSPMVGVAAPAFGVAVDGYPFKAPVGEPEQYINKDERSMVPIRFVAYALGLEDKDFTWDMANLKATIQDGVKHIEIVEGKDELTVDGKSVKMDTVAELKHGRLFIPARFIAEALDRKVIWDGKNKTVHVWNLPDENRLYDASLDFEKGIISTEYFEAKEGQLYFRDEYIEEPYSGYVLKETLVDNLNDRVYKMLHYLLNDSYYAYAQYVPEYEDFDAAITVGMAYNAGFFNAGRSFFQFVINEQVPMRSHNSNQVQVGLTLRTLKWASIEDAMNDVIPDPINPMIENKLRMALVGLFGDKTGIDIHNYIMDLKKYQIAHDYEPVKKQSKVIGNIQVDVEPQGTTFIFSFTNKGAGVL